MDKRIDRLRRRQQRLWRKSASTILSLHYNLALLVAFLTIVILGTFWILVDQKLEKHLILNAQSYGYGISRYSSTDLKDLLLSDDKKTQQSYMQRLTADPIINEALLYDNLGTLLAVSSIISETNKDAGTTDKSNTLIILEDIIHDQKRLGMIQLEINRTTQEAPIQKLLNLLAIFTVVMMILTTFIAWLVTRRLTRSLRQLFKVPVNTPEENSVEDFDVGSELKLLLESTSNDLDSPAPVSRAERSGIHQLLALDSVAESSDVIIMNLRLPHLADWLKPDRGTPNVQLLRKLDRLLIMTIHSQQGHLLNFDGMTAQACFGLNGKVSAAVYKAVSCCQLLKIQLDEISLNPKFCLRKEERLLIRHMKRTPVAIPIHDHDVEPDLLFSSNKLWLILNKNISEDKRLLDQITLKRINEDWMSIKEVHPTAQSMIERQLTWIRYLLTNAE